MSWFFVDDKFPSHRKVKDIPKESKLPAIGLWSLAGAWCRAELTGGSITLNQVEDLGGTLALAEALVRCRLWKKTRTGFRFHDWAEWQETPGEVKTKRKLNKDRQQKWRDKRKHNRTVAARNGVTPALVTRLSPGEGEGEGTEQVEGRSKVLGVVPVPPTGDARLDRINSDLGLYTFGARR